MLSSLTDLATADDYIVIGLVALVLWLPCFIYVVHFARLPFYHPTFLYVMYHLVGFVVRPFAIANTGSQTWGLMGASFSSGELFYTVGIAEIGLLAFVFAPLLILPSLYRDTRFKPITASVKSPIGFALTSIVLVGLGLIGVSATSSFSDTELRNYTTVYLPGGGQALTETSGYVTMLESYLLATVVALIVLVRNHVLVFSVVIAFVAFRFTQGSGRSSFIAVGLVLVLIWLVRQGRTMPKWRHGIAAALVLVVFDVLGSDRLAVRNLIAGRTDLWTVLTNYQQARAGALLSSDFAEFDAASVTIRAIHNSGVFNFGSQYLRLLIWPIPRQLWPDKPVLTDLVTYTGQSNWFSVITKTLVADMYSNFGVFSVLLGMGLYSVALAWLHKKAASTTSTFGLLVYAILFGYITIVYRDGGISALYFVLVSVPPLWLLATLGRVKLVRETPGLAPAPEIGLAPIQLMKGRGGLERRTRAV